MGERSHEETIIARARDGDTDAFEELVRAHSGRVYRLLTRILGDAAAAEDIAQETFVRAWRALPGFRGDAMFATWLYRIATNEANRFLAREARHPVLPLDEATVEVADLSADPAGASELGELAAKLEEFLAELPPSYRIAVVLRDVEGLTNEEAADMLGLSIRNFKSRLHRGRMAIRRRLEELQGGT